MWTMHLVRLLGALVALQDVVVAVVVGLAGVVVVVEAEDLQLDALRIPCLLCACRLREWWQ
jgi:hypothetical protein